MRRAPIALLCTAACAILAIPAISSATPEIGQKNNGWSITDETYLRTYEKCWKAFKEDCGANLLDYAWKGGKPTSEAQVKESTATMERWLSPPEPATVAVDSPASIAPPPVTTSVPPAPASTSGCVGMEAESGSLGYANNTNPDYVGCYQISVDHYAPGGLCAGGSTDPAGQDACAGIICAEQGAGAWTNPAGQNPCGTLP